MHFGLLSIFQNYRDEQDDAEIMRGELALARLAEEVGYDSYWATEHHFFGYSMCPDNLQWLAQVAGCTSRIKLGTGAVIMPWNDPYRVAAKMALLDQQSGGRALLGFGRGLSRREYERFTIPMDEARDRFDQGTQLVLEALNKGFFEADTEYFTRPRADLRPRPTAGFQDRVYSIGVSPDSATQAAVLGAQLMVLAQQPWEVFRQQALEPFQEKWRSLRDTEPPPPFAGQLVYCDRDPERARELGTQYVKEYFATVVEHYEIGGEHFKQTKGYEFYGNAAEAISAMGLDAMAEMYAGVNTFGTPEQIVEQLRNQKEILGCEHDILVIPKYGNMTQEEAEASVTLFANEVIPAFRGS
ncbi:MAG: LLM class flavin-dependent oxidoreductase [Deltaproteobacteria bacterium]|nr:LLM class flavin-dependent oxidoreductase [Deltaproteobacteria bacterium]MBW2724662.1 LLM class flavin-dependent oxidoreductase [Deltaproteobacteria bacterium]